MACPTAAILFEDYFRATIEYFDATDTLANIVGSHEWLTDAQQRTEQTHAKCQSAHFALAKHRAEHNCGIEASGKSQQ